MKKVLFVCLGNICRSPAAEIVFSEKIRRGGFEHQISCESAATHNYHPGKAPDARMAATLEKRDYPIIGCARHFQAVDFDNFDLIIHMDEENLSNLKKVVRHAGDAAKLRSFASFCTRHKVNEIPDPYYGGQEGFDLVADLIEDGCENLLAELITRSTI